IFPSTYGGHSWQPMSYDSITGLVYIPVIETPLILFNMDRSGGSIRQIDGQYDLGMVIPKNYNPSDLTRLFGSLPPLRTFKPDVPIGKSLLRNVLRAWDPVGQRTVWEKVTSTGDFVLDGGVLSTSSNLVFQGRASGELWVYAADTGKVLARIDTGS